MTVETERKFLLQSAIPDLQEGILYVQAYLCKDPDKTVRVRIAGDKGYLTIKGRTNGISRPEYEYEIPVTDARDLLLICDDVPIKKTRYRVPYKEHYWEVDIFHAENEGLQLAEIELSAEDETFEMPSWIGQEVTSDVRFYNSYLSLHPFNTW